MSEGIEEEEFEFTNEIIKAEGEAPSLGLNCHTACVIHDHMYIFGGSEVYDSYSNLTYEYSFLHKLWKKIEPIGEQQPSGRKFHTAVVYNSKMYIWGGYHFPENFRELNQIYEFNPINYEYKLLDTQNNPTASFRHSASIRKYKGKTSMIIFGGFSHSYLNDLYEYHFDEYKWDKIEPDSEMLPPPRYCHSAVIVDQNLYIYGGMSVSNGVHKQLYVFNFLNKSWKMIENGFENKKWNHTCLYNRQFNEFWFFGVEFSIFNFSTLYWKQFKIKNFQGIRNGTTNLYKGNLYVLGGFKDDVLSFINLDWKDTTEFIFKDYSKLFDNFTDVIFKLQ